MFLHSGYTRIGSGRHAYPNSTGVIEECAFKHIPAALIISAGFREMGRASEELEQQVRAVAQRSGMGVIGPNYLGAMSPGRPHQRNVCSVYGSAGTRSISARVARSARQ